MRVKRESGFGANGQGLVDLEGMLAPPGDEFLDEEVAGIVDMDEGSDDEDGDDDDRED